MNRLKIVLLCSVMLLLGVANSVDARDVEKKAGNSDKPDPNIGSMKLLAGYKHVVLQGIDSKVGKIEKAGGLSISYEIGAIPKPAKPGGFAFVLGGSFSDRPKNTPATLRNWYKEQTVNGLAMHVAHKKDGYLIASFPAKGINFSVKVKDSAELAEALLMIMTYPTK